MSDLVEFLKARLEEDEHFARRTRSGEWTFDELGQLLVNQGQTISKIANLGVANFGQHIARHDPARVLRQVAVGRRTLALHSPAQPGRYDRNDVYECQGCGVEGPNEWAVTENIDECPELRDLASIYEGAPGWRERWRA